MRIVVALLLGAALLLAVVGEAPPEDRMLARQIWLAGITIAAYWLLGLVSFLLARRHRFRPWMPWAFVTCDAGFIIVSLAIGLVNAESPANFAVAFPVVWLVPLILASGALRYNPYLQAYIVVLLIVGLGLGALAVAPWVPPPGDVPPARLGVLFQIPPNIMRLVMVALAGVVLVVAVVRGRRLLARGIAEMRRRAALSRYLPPQVADWVATHSPDSARRGRRQHAAILFADIRDFTAAAEDMDPVDLGFFITDFRRCVTDAARETAGVVDKFVGDSAMIVFGVPEPGERDARNALDCAAAILRNVRRWNKARTAAGRREVEVGIGGHWGEVFCGAVGDDSRLEFTVLGDTVNVAARIEEMTKEARLPLVVSRDLLIAAGRHRGGEWTALRARRLRGREAATELYGAEGVEA